MTKEQLFNEIDNNNLPAIKELLLKGLSINSTFTFGWTPLMYAIALEHWDIVEYFLDKEANCRISGSNPYVIMKGNVKPPFIFDAIIYNTLEGEKIIDYTNMCELDAFSILFYKFFKKESLGVGLICSIEQCERAIYRSLPLEEQHRSSIFFGEKLGRRKYNRFDKILINIALNLPKSFILYVWGKTIFRDFAPYFNKLLNDENYINEISKMLKDQYFFDCKKMV